jgi:hypothetical protein
MIQFSAPPRLIFMKGAPDHHHQEKTLQAEIHPCNVVLIQIQEDNLFFKLDSLQRSLPYPIEMERTPPTRLIMGREMINETLGNELYTSLNS